MAWNIGEQFQMVTVSIDPKESVQRAAQSKEKYLRIYDRADRTEGWHWLVAARTEYQARSRHGRLPL